MLAKLIQICKNQKGTTFIELLLYIAIFLVLTPVLLTMSIQAIRLDSRHDAEKQVNADSQFVVERIYDLVSAARKVDVSNTVLNDADGKLTLVMQDDSVVVIEKEAGSNAVKITEDSLTSNLSADNLVVSSLYFERITDQLGDPEIILGVNTRLHASGPDEFAVEQEYFITANLEKADFDGDGCVDFMDAYARHPQCCGDSDGDGACDELDNCVLEYNPFQEDFDYDSIGDACDMSGPLTPFNCASDTELLALVDQFPPLSSAQLKQALMSASPLSPNVLNGLIDRQKDPASVIGQAHFRDIFVNNSALPTDVYNNFLTLDSNDLSTEKQQDVIDAHDAAPTVAWDDQDQCAEITYEVSVIDGGESVEYKNASIPLDSGGTNVSDTFFVCSTGGSTIIEVTIYDGWSTDSATLNGVSDTVIILGFQITFESLVGTNYAFIVTTGTNPHPMDTITFDFGAGNDSACTLEGTYTTTRQLDYFPGGCVSACGDVGTGVVAGNIITDQCYRFGGNYYLHWDGNGGNRETNDEYMDTLASNRLFLCDYDENEECNEFDVIEEPGLTIKKGYLASDQKTWHDFTLIPAFYQDFNIVGDLQLHLWSAMEGFETVGTGTVIATLFDNDESQVISSQSISNTSWPVDDFANLIITLGDLNYTVPAGNELILRLTVDVSTSTDGMWFAFDTIDYRSRIILPTTNKNHPDWCYLWQTSEDNDEVNPAFMGSTIPDEETVYWEKEFKSLLSQSQIDVLESITITGEVAYQSTTQFFCDTLSASCPMNGNLVGSQNVELYNWVTDNWDVVGALVLDGTISDQQTFEVIYGDDGPENKVDEYIGGEDGRMIKARMQFHWLGNPPVGTSSSPSFMLIDYFVLHLKW